MEQPFFYFLFVVLVGGIIGGGTNLLAIKMLFRPYRPVFLANYRIPFTPGVIPGKQSQLAEKIASVVTNYILTPTAVSQGLKKTGVQVAIRGSLLAQFQKLENNQECIGNYLNTLGIEQIKIANYLTEALIRQLIKANNPKFAKTQTESFIAHFGNIAIENLIPEPLLSSIEKNINSIIPLLLKHISDHMQDTTTRIAIIEMIDQTLEVKNSLLRKMLFSIINDSKIQDQIIKKLQKLIESEAVQRHIEHYLQEQWKQIVSKSIHGVRDQWPAEYEQVLSILNRSIHKGLQRSLHSDQLANSIRDEMIDFIDNVWKTPVSTFHKKATPYIEGIVNWISEITLMHLEENVEELLHTLNIHGIVEEQVLSFPAEKLEAMILQVAKKELHYIAYIGVVLGGIMGVIQFLVIYNTL